jgi:hypothetical protein
MNASLASMRMQGSRPEPQAIFDSADGDGDGSLNVDELQELIDGMPARPEGEGPSSEELLSQLDTDGDGALSFAEFEAGRPQGPPPGMAPPGAGGAGGMDLAQLFAGGEEDEETVQSLYKLLV